MRWRSLVACLAFLAAIVGSGVCTRQSQAAGYWNMPGTVAQRVGCGFGAGYHAPFILGPIRCDGWHLDAPVRLPYAPTPYYTCGEYGDSRMIDTPTALNKSVSTKCPALVPTVAAPTPVESRSIESNAISLSGASVPELVIESAVEPAANSVRPLFPAPVQN